MVSIQTGLVSPRLPSGGQIPSANACVSHGEAYPYGHTLVSPRIGRKLQAAGVAITSLTLRAAFSRPSPR